MSDYAILKVVKRMRMQGNDGTHWFKGFVGSAAALPIIIIINCVLFQWD